MLLQLSVPVTLIRPKGVAKQNMKWAMRIIVGKSSPKAPSLS